VEITCHEEVQTTNVGEVDATQLKDVGGNKCDQVNDQQILGNCRYAEYHRYLSFILITYLKAFILILCAKLLKISRFSVKNTSNTIFFY
jgi:hypothetical protein